MDPRLYTYERRTPRLQNPTFKSNFVRDSLQVFKKTSLGTIDSLDSSCDKITQSMIRQNKQSRELYNPPQISKIRSLFQNNRSRVAVSNLSSYGRQIMFPLQNQSSYQVSNPQSPQRFFNKQLFMDNKQKNYIKQITKMNQEYLPINKSLDMDAAGKPTIIYDDKDKRYYRYKHSYDREIQMNNSQNYHNSNNTSHNHNSHNNNNSHHNHNKQKSTFRPSRLNYADQMKGII